MFRIEGGADSDSDEIPEPESRPPLLNQSPDGSGAIEVKLTLVERRIHWSRRH